MNKSTKTRIEKKMVKFYKANGREMNEVEVENLIARIDNKVGTVRKIYDIEINKDGKLIASIYGEYARVTVEVYFEGEEFKSLIYSHKESLYFQ